MDEAPRYKTCWVQYIVVRMTPEYTLPLHQSHFPCSPQLSLSPTLSTPRLYRGASFTKKRTPLGPYGRSIWTFLRAVRALTFESPLYGSQVRNLDLAWAVFFQVL